ncbi:hypothetical protein A2U01_0048294, partial [Trifolium medium]|nr:hypothetical protein [Trifolium medium]
YADVGVSEIELEKIQWPVQRRHRDDGGESCRCEAGTETTAMKESRRTGSSPSFFL